MLITTLLTLSGAFSGPGSAVTPLRTRPCSEIFVDVELSEQSFTMFHGGYICRDLQASYDRYRMEVRDGELFSRGQRVGQLTADALEISFEDRDEGFRYELTLRQVSPLQLEYREVWREGERESLSVRGTLLRLD